MGPLEPIVGAMIGGMLKFVLFVLVPILVLMFFFGKRFYRFPKPLRAIILLIVAYALWLVFVKFGT